MNPAVASVIVAGVGVIGAVIGAFVSAWLNRDRDDADTAEKISAAWDPVFERMDKDLSRVTAQCEKCQSELADVKVTHAQERDVLRGALESVLHINASIAPILERIIHADPAIIGDAERDLIDDLQQTLQTAHRTLWDPPPSGRR